MAIQPSDRFAGSAHILRFQGTLVPQAAPGFQTVNGEVAGPVVAGVPVQVRFALADMSSLADTQKRLPSNVFDDSQPAANSPHSNTATMGPTAGGKTWAQNIRVRAQSLPANPLVPEILTFNELFPAVQLDGPVGSSLGLEQNTGVPVVIMSIAFTAAGVAALVPQGPGCSIGLEIEVPHTVSR